MMTIVSPILIVVAAIFKAVADTVDHHFDTSVFRRLNVAFWDRDISSDRAKRIGGYKVDAWHLCMSAMIILFILAAAFHKAYFAWYWELAIGWPLWNFPFNLFYNVLLRRK